MNFESRQLNKTERYMNNIKAFLISDIKGDKLLVRIPGEKESFANIPVSAPEDFKVGEYIDLIFVGRYYNGKLSSYSIQFIGKTPSKYIPDNEE